MNKLFGHLAAASWGLLAIVTLYGAWTRHPDLIAINYVMAAGFTAIGGFVLWRTRTMERLFATTPAQPETRAAQRVEAIASFVMFLFGAVCLSGAAHRVWGEQMSVFG